MTYQKDPFEFEKIPDYALQPAKEADEYNFHYVPRGATSRFDPAAYEKVLHDSVKQAAESEEQSEMLNIQAEKALNTFGDTETEFFPLTMDEILPDSNSGLDEAVLAEAAPTWIVEPVSEAGPEDEPVLAEPATDGFAVEELVSAEAEMDEFAAAEPFSAEPCIPEEEAAGAFEEGSIQIPSDTEEEVIPVFAKAAARPVYQPIFVPKTVPPKIVPVTGSTLSSKLKLVDMKKREPLRITIEEDILVPDVKPDLERILAMDGKIRLADREIPIGQAAADRVRFTGDLILQTVYVPIHRADGEPFVAIESRIPFKNETEMTAGPNSDLVVSPSIESIEYSVINERKFRARAVVVFGLKEYSKVEVEVFEGVRDVEVQMLKEKINLTDVALRKTEPFEIKDDFILKENMPEILKILKYDINVIENHKQITKEKAVINASVYCSILYLGSEEKPESENAEDAEAAAAGDAVPVLYQGKTEFTQFIRLDDESSDQNPAGSKVSFHITSAALTPKEDGNGKKCLIGMEMNVDTGLDLYKTIEKEVVTDVYHHKKDVQFETDEIGLTSLGGSGVAEISAREIINIPERYGNVDQVVYLSGNISEKRAFIDQAKSVVEGIVAVNLICTSSDSGKTAFNVTQEIPFRSAMEIPGITPEMTANNDMVLKELWFDKINNKQIEVNAGILVNTAVASQAKHQLVKNVSFLDPQQDGSTLPGIVLYIARSGDTIWKVAKKYRTTIDEIRKVNEIEFGKEIKPGTKLLIVAKNQ